MSVIPTISNHSFLLYGYMCFRAVPPQYEVAVDSFTEVINRNKRDFEALYYRACASSCLQEWTSVIKDLTTIIAFKPTDSKTLMLRARTYSCIRQWDLALEDCRLLLKYHPSKEEQIKKLIAELSPMQETALSSYWVTAND